ncbi:hypothetical protein QJS10_CPA08g01746 [Acorus calamus]|uniref:DUF7894 domain-containing protein n=1 Tax=Acorus calamus TaxID=4465 RepID=A0AAV9ECS5_ACOCL|nr:hypothetical protein QJS10_CPA08g01746 [Acorus calamus]
MEVGPHVIVLVRDTKGFGSAIAGALHPNPNSSLTRSESKFELSLEKYGIKDSKASGDIVRFVHPNGSIELSILLLPNYEPPVAACAVNEILESILAEKTAFQPTFILPIISLVPKLNSEMGNLTSSEKNVTVFGFHVGSATKSTDALTAGIPVLPSSWRIPSESLACLVQLVRVLKLPTVMLVASSGHQQIGKTAYQEVEDIALVS